MRLLELYCVFVISLGIVLTKGHGKNVFIGNVSVEEGKDIQISTCKIKIICMPLFTAFRCFSTGLHDLTASDVSIANEW